MSDSSSIAVFKTFRWRGQRAHGPREWDEIVEVSSGAILPDREGLYLLELNTARGTRYFKHAEEVSDAESESASGHVWWTGSAIEVGFGDEHRELIVTLLRRRAFPGVTQPPEAVPASYAGAALKPTQPSQSSRPLDPNREPSPDEVLERLADQSLSHIDERMLVIAAEAIAFQPHQYAGLLNRLRDFISRCRESNDPEDLLAVAAAVRKCVATMSVDEALAYAANLLEAGLRVTVPPEVELEVAKMVVRKLTANPQKATDSMSELAVRLVELATTYLKPRLLLREKLGAIALNAVLGLALLGSPHVSKIAQVLSELEVPWFQELVAQRAGRLREELVRRFPDQQLPEVDDALARLEAQA